MDIGLVNRLKFMRDEAGKIVVAMEPNNNAEWEALEVTTNVHKQLMKLEFDKLTQTAMKFEPEPEKAEQPPLTEEHAVVPGEDSLNEGSEDLSHLVGTDEKRNPTLCLTCQLKDTCNGDPICIVNGEEKCGAFKGQEDPQTEKKQRRSRKSA